MAHKDKVLSQQDLPILIYLNNRLLGQLSSQDNRFFIWANSPPLTSVVPSTGQIYLLASQITIYSSSLILKLSCLSYPLTLSNLITHCAQF